MATIEVLVTDQAGSPNRTVVASPNHAAADRRELVIWNIRPSSELFQVVFKKFQSLPNDPLQAIPAQGPFPQPLTTAPGQVYGTIDIDLVRTRDGLYVYEIQDAAGIKLEWLNPLSVGSENFGGLDVPKPPRGGGA